ncbi:MAG TPA: histidine kinase, partial [Bryobacteraceae bacterium]|nr:histidine kinase [Bryobacteraceae bacterium]
MMVWSSHFTGRGSAASLTQVPTSATSSSGYCPHGDAWADMLITASHSYVGVAGLSERSARLQHAAAVFQQVERERARVARELHAGAGQPLAGIKLNVEILQERAESMDDPARAALDRLVLLSEQALDQVRTLSHRMHPLAWQRRGLSVALRTLVRTSGVQQRFGTTNVEIADIYPEPGRAARAALYRCAQECISNAIRHSRASSFSIRLQPSGDW